MEYTNSVFNEIIDYFEKHLYATRFTLSGGDPIFAPEITQPLCKKIKEIRPDVKIWLYTGCIFENILDDPILKYIDVIIDGPFILEQRDITLRFRGSANQRIIDVQESIKKGETILYGQQ